MSKDRVERRATLLGHPAVREGALAITALVQESYGCLDSPMASWGPSITGLLASILAMSMRVFALPAGGEPRPDE